MVLVIGTSGLLGSYLIYYSTLGKKDAEIRNISICPLKSIELTFQNTNFNY
jgi:hypothetical protein